MNLNAVGGRESNPQAFLLLLTASVIVSFASKCPRKN